MAGAFVPVQVMIYPLVRVMALAGIFGSLPAIVLVHVVFGMPIMTLLFRNYYCSMCRRSCSTPRASTAAASGASSCR
jgi:glucose/mannose transport system permease protein